jgi:YHS domain-containing protein
MKSKRTQFGIVFTLASLSLIGLVAISSCKKKPEPVPPTETKEVVSAKIQQTTCPVMAGPINKNIFAEYKGKKVYFCCAGCKEAFEKEPEKYLDKLPQFNE